MSRTYYIGDIVTVIVDGQKFTGTIYYIRENGWANVETPDGHIASGPILEKGYNSE